MAFFQSLRWPCRLAVTALELARDLHRIDADGGFLEEHFHRVLDFLLGRAGRHLKDVLIVLFRQGGAFSVTRTDFKIRRGSRIGLFLEAVESLPSALR